MTNTLRVIGAGFGRTGTDSMREALEMLGFGPCHHMRAVIENPAHRADWMKAISTGDMDWDLLLGGYRSCIDWPSAYYWPQLVEKFPDAKVLLTWRTAESWWASFAKTILPAVQAIEERGETSPGSLLTQPLIFKGKPMEKDYCISVYEENVAAVKEAVPANQLLVYKLGDGWAPLCEFLGVDVPEVPFPRSNNPKEFQEWAAK